ncbi:MAG: glycosyltransferase family 2 protein [Alphaproteobacteria bacterium]|nr:glycosyltransferase family 2 protein [Alphaproteobacteria bacterium]
MQNKINYLPKVSVIIPVYNVDKYLHECLDSVVNQTLKEIEIICIDDGSTDNSLKILYEYAKKDKRFTIIAQKHLYAGVARNAGLSVAKGEYLSFLDSDDFFELEMLEKMYQKAKQNKADICVCGAFFYDNLTQNNLEKKCCLNMDNLPEKPFVINSLHSNCYNWTTPCAWNKIFSRKFVNAEKIRFQSSKSCNDAYFTIVALSLAQSICICPDVLVHYRINTSSSISAHRDKSNHSILNVYLAAKKVIKSKRPELLHYFTQKLFENTKGEWRLCGEEAKQYFALKAKKVLGADYKYFRKIFTDKTVKKYTLFGFLPLLSIEEK